jgi:hypothetical protein
MRFYLKHQVCKDSDSWSTIKADCNRPAKTKDSFITGLEDNAREVLLFSTSLIFLLFNLLEGNTDRKVDT